MSEQGGTLLGGEWAADGGAGDTGITEAELTDLALAADPDAPLAEDAVPLSVYLEDAPGLLPAWYMPSPMVRGARAGGFRWCW